MSEPVSDIQRWMDEKPSRGFCVIGKGKACHISRGNDESLCGKLMMPGSRYIDSAETLDFTPCRSCWKIMERESAEIERVGNMAAKLTLGQVRGDIRIGSSTGSAGVPHAIKETTEKGNVPYCSAKMKNPLRSWGPAAEQNPNLDLCAGCSKAVPTGPVKITATEVEIPGLGRTVTAKVITPVNADTNEEKTEEDAMAATAAMNKETQDQAAATVREDIERLPSLIIEGKEEAATELSESIRKDLGQITGTGAAAVKAKLRAELNKVLKDAKKAKADKDKAEKEAAKAAGTAVAVSKETTLEATLKNDEIQALVAKGQEQVKAIAVAKFKGGHTIAETIIRIRTEIQNKDGHPDLNGDTDASKKNTTKVFDGLLEGLPEEGEDEAADAIRAEVESVKKSYRNSIRDVRARYLQALDNSPKEAKKYAYALEAHPDMKPSEAVAEFHGYELRTRAEIARADRERKALEAKKLEEAVKNGELSEEEAAATLNADSEEKTPKELRAAWLKKQEAAFKRQLKVIKAIENAEEQEEALDELTALLTTVRKEIKG
ncbi:hypothetical protein ACWECC_32830 [Streptomyces microflavus]